MASDDEDRLSRAEDRVHDAIEDAKLLLWVGRLEKAQERLDELATVADAEIIDAARAAFEERQSELRNARKRHKLRTEESMEVSASKKRINWGQEKEAARKREAVAKDISKTGVHERFAADLIPSIAALNSLQRRLEREEKDQRTMERYLQRLFKKDGREDSDEPTTTPELPMTQSLTLGRFTTLILPLGEEKYELRLLDLPHANHPFKEEDLARVKPLRGVPTIMLSGASELRETPTFRIFAEQGTAEFYFHSKGIGRASMTLRDPRRFTELAQLGLRTVGFDTAMR